MEGPQMDPLLSLHLVFSKPPVLRGKYPRKDPPLPHSTATKHHVEEGSGLRTACGSTALHRPSQSESSEPDPSGQSCGKGSGGGGGH